MSLNSTNNQKMVFKKWVLMTMALILVLSVLSACGKKNKDDGAGKPVDIVATYKGGGKVTRAEFDTFVNVNKMFSPQLAQFASDPSFQQDILKQLIILRVLSADANDKVKADADKQVADQMKQINDYFSKQEGGIDKLLKDNNVKLSDIENVLKLNFYVMGSMENKITDQQVQDTYNKEAAAHEFDIATVSHILISLQDAATQKDIRTKDEALARAKEVKAKLDQGGDFAALAKEYSDDPGSKDNGGTYKDADINQWVPEFKEAATTLPLNKISDPVESSFGYHIMKVESRSTKPLDDTLKKQIKSELASEQLSDFEEKEYPSLVETNNLPKPEASPAQSANPEASAAPSPK